MPESRPCPTCGEPVVDRAPEALCPACLIQTGLSLLEASETKNPTPPVASAGSPKRFGNYELLEEIARGGMGIVYRARQIALQRTVAVKVLLFGEFSSDDFVRRFKTEATAAASLHHPNIVAIHEVGEHDGRHYFSMDLIEGQSLADLTRRGPLPARTAAGHLEKIALAIHYAHQQGVIHRDLKPSNVLIDAAGEPHITDFGLAKRLADDGELTATGQVLGSPNFMPPEQAEPSLGSVGPSGDIYSLGALLYHLLTGRPPFVGDSVQSTLRQLLHDEPAAPRVLNSTIPLDLETICLKCLQKEPARRYTTAEELAAELRRFRLGQPVLARPIGAYEKFVRWCRRERALATLTLALGTVLVVGLVATTLLLWQERRARLRATAAEHAESQLRQQMERQKDLATAEAAKSQQLATFLQEMLNRAGPSASLGRDTTLLREVLDQTAARIDRELTNQPAVVAELRDTIGRTYCDIGDYANAVAMHRESIRLRTELGDAATEAGARSMHLLAQALADMGELDEAETLNLRAIELRRKLLPADDPKIAGALNNLGNVHFRRRNLAKAKECFEQALEIYRRTDDPNTSAPLHNLGNILALQNQFAAAEKLYREAVALARKVHGDSHPTTALYLRNLGDVLRAQGKLAEAGAAHGEALATRASLLDELHPSLADSLERLGAVKSQQQQWADAETLYRKALASRRKQAPSDPSIWAEDASALADVLNAQKRFADSEVLLSELIAAAPAEESRAAKLFELRGQSRARNGRWAEAAEDIARAYALAPNDEWYGYLLGILLAAAGDEARWKALCQDELARNSAAASPDRAYRAALITLLKPQADLDAEALRGMLAAALAKSARTGGNPYGSVINALAELRLRRADVALAEVDVVLDGFARGKVQGRYLHIQASLVRALALVQLGRFDEARASLDRARAITPAKLELPKDSDYSTRWHEWLILHQLLREAESAIRRSQ